MKRRDYKPARDMAAILLGIAAAVCAGVFGAVVILKLAGVI